MGGGRGMLSGTQRIECRICRGRVEIDGTVQVFEGGCQKRVRQDGDKVLCAETEPSNRSECVDGSKAY